jgi:abortive infection bacteriophage resistance protein
MTQNNPYNKPHATAALRIDHLRAKGLVVTRPKIAARKIEEIGYERLRIYFLSRRNLDVAGKPFVAGTTYKHIIRLYECDAKLRDICLRGVGRFELVLRNRMSETLSAQFGSHPYFEAKAFGNSKKQNEALQTILNTFMKSRDARAKHYQSIYTEPQLPPIWMIKEFLTFGASARLYSALTNNIRGKIANDFGVPSIDVFDSWMNCFVDLRNLCAHHDRIFNRGFQKQPQRLKRSNTPSGDPSKLKAQLECLDFSLHSAEVKSNLVVQVKNALDRYPEIKNAESGF